MPPSGKTTNAKRYWIGVVTNALGEMPEKYRQQQVLDHIDDLDHPHPHPRPADVTLKGYIKEIGDSAADAPWMDEPWTIGALGRLRTLGINLDAADIKAITNVHGYALVYDLPITIRRAIWIARLRELLDDPYSLYIEAGNYASAERSSSALHQPMDTSVLDAHLATNTRGRIPNAWDLEYWELVLANSEKLKDQYVLYERQNFVTENQRRDGRFLKTGLTDWLQDLQIIRFEDRALQDALVLAIRVLRRSNKDLKLSNEEIETRIREIHRLISENDWPELRKVLGYKSIYFLKSQHIPQESER